MKMVFMRKEMNEMKKWNDFVFLGLYMNEAGKSKCKLTVFWYMNDEMRREKSIAKLDGFKKKKDGMEIYM